MPPPPVASRAVPSVLIKQDAPPPAAVLRSNLKAPQPPSRTIPVVISSYNELSRTSVQDRLSVANSKPSLSQSESLNSLNLRPSVGSRSISDGKWTFQSDVPLPRQFPSGDPPAVGPSTGKARPPPPPPRGAVKRAPPPPPR